MTTKTKTASSTPSKKATKKATAKPKAVVVKEATPKKPVAKKIVKKAPEKKIINKAVAGTIEVTKQEVIASTPEVKIEVTQPTMPVMAMIKEEVQVANKPVEVHHKIVYIGTCRNCEHIPMKVDKLVAVMAVMGGVVSLLLISAVSPIHFSVPALSLNSVGSWLTSLVL